MKIPATILRIIGTFFYVGNLPLIPGTFGSLAGLFLYYLSRDNPLYFALSLFFATILGFLVSGRLEDVIGKKDPRCIVIDEVSGMLLSFIFLPYDLRIIITGFLLFRLLDTLKPFPAGRLQELKGSVGIMGDDLVAGLYTNIILQVVFRLVSFKTS